jgi:hypothetical protein
LASFDGAVSRTISPASRRLKNGAPYLSGGFILFAAAGFG